MKCPTCRKTIPFDIHVCKRCGTRIPRLKRGARPKTAAFSRLSPRQLRIAGVGVMGLLIIAAHLMFSPHRGMERQVGRSERLDREITIERRRANRETAPNAVLGKVMTADIGENSEGTITVKSLHTGRIHTFSVGWQTSYHPRRYPSIGERVKVYFLADEDVMKATQVTIGR